MSREYGITNVAPWAAAPAVGAAGDTYFNTTTKTLYISDGTAWIALGAATPPGVVEAYAGTSYPPAGYLLCDGSLVSRTTYAALFAAIGTTFGVGDGSTTFALPDLRARYIGGFKVGDTYFGVLGGFTGSNTHSHVLNDKGVAQITMQAGTGADMIRMRRINVPATPGNYNANTSNSSSLSFAASSAANGTAVGLEGSTELSDGFPVVQTVVMNYIIKT